MSIPNWYSLLLLVGAAFRTWKLLAEDTILERPRHYSYEAVFRRWGLKGKLYWQEFLECPWCIGFWVSLAWWGGWQLWPHGTLIAAVPLVISALVGLVGSLGD